MSDVLSVDPSSITMISKSLQVWLKTDWMVLSRYCEQLYVGMITLIRGFMRLLLHNAGSRSRTSKKLWLGFIIGICVFVRILAINADAVEVVVIPGQSIGKVAESLVAGDVLRVRKGTYVHGVTLSGLKGNEKKPIIITGEPGVVIEAEGRDGIFLEDCEYMFIEDLTVQGAQRAGILMSSSRHITIRDCHITDNRKWGIQTCLSDYITIERCEISGSELEHGIYFSTTDHPKVVDCRIYDNACCGVHLNGDRNEGGDGLITDGVIRGNFIYENGKSGGAAINMDGAEGMLVRDNMIFNNYAGGITSFHGDGLKAGANNRFLNNVVYFRQNQGRYALQLFGEIKNITVKQNVLVCGKGPVLEFADAPGNELISNDNVYYAYDRERLIQIGDQLMGMEDWRKEGYDKDSVVRKISLSEDEQVRIIE